MQNLQGSRSAWFVLTKSHFSFYLEAPSNLGSFTADASSVVSSIKYHAEFTPSFSAKGFKLQKAYFATAQSVRDALIVNWNSTYDHYERLNVKEAYYLSMEFLQVRIWKKKMQFQFVKLYSTVKMNTG